MGVAIYLKLNLQLVAMFFFLSLVYRDYWGDLLFFLQYMISNLKIWHPLEKKSGAVYYTELLRMRHLRVVSVLPSATELLCAIGGKDLLVGRSHEDNYPLDIADRPILTSRLTVSTTPAEINAEVSQFISQGKSLYGIDVQLLERLKPDVILTQDICNVCAIDLETVERIAQRMNPIPRIISLNPESLEDVINSVDMLGRSLCLEAESLSYKESLLSRIRLVQEIGASAASRPKVGFIEWSDPIFVAGHWTPQLIHYAGGVHTLNPCAELPDYDDDTNNVFRRLRVRGAGKSFPVSKQVFQASDPDVIIISPCGFDLNLSEQEAIKLLKEDWFRSLRAVQNNALYVVDGDAMFNRPGPRLVDALEWLAFILHPTDLKATKLLPPNFAYIHINTSSVPPNSSPAKEKTRREVSIEEAHLAACEAGETLYSDPETGFSVFTEVTLRKRGKCCGNKCRHCPYGHVNVAANMRTNIITKPTLLLASTRSGVYDSMEESIGTDVLFWSGGKDSYLSYLYLFKDTHQKRRIVLLTTIDETSGDVPHQGVSSHAVMDQGKALKLDHMVVPLPSTCSNADYVARVTSSLALIESKFKGPLRLVFGDLHLEDLVAWRKSSLPEYECFFPLFNIPYPTLLQTLAEQRANVEITVTACSGTPVEGIKVGDAYDNDLLGRLPAGWDSFGERGEFHTYVKIRGPH